MAEPAQPAQPGLGEAQFTHHASVEPVVRLPPARHVSSTVIY